MRESCEIGHSFAHLYRREKSALSRFWRLRFGRGRPSYIKTKNSSLGLRDRRCLLHDGGEWVSDRGDSAAGGTVRAQTQNVGNLEILDRQPTCASSLPHGRRWNRSRGSHSGPKMCRRKKGRGPHVGVPLHPRHSRE